ncbi:MAG: DUF2341 domain-containing protein [Terracidiphilus sp.]
MKVSRSTRIAFLFLSAFLFQTDRLMASAATVPPGACLYALDPTADRAFQIAGAQSVYTACGVVVESSASDGFEMEGAETLYLENHTQVSVVGGAQFNGQTELWDTISNKQVQPVKVSSPGDPLTSVAVPTTGTIVSKTPAYFDMNSKPANNTLSPGVYCGGLTIGNTNGTAFTMSPGTYIMAGGGLVLNSQAVVKGTGVTVYNTSSAGWGCSSSYKYTPVTISGQVTATLSAPTSGAFNGILFFGNRSGCSTKGSCVDQINGGSTTVLNGALYFASDEIEITGSNASGYMMLVADKIYINGNSNFGNNGNPFDGITVSVSPSNVTLFATQTQQFTATVNNSANPAVTWSISPAGVGSISSSGLYTAPSTVAAQQTVTVTATSQADTSKSGTAAVTLAINKTTPTITWATPAAITYGTALSGTQLDATASVPGTFAYTPTAGTVLTAGSQTLSVVFTPTDTTDYSNATASVPLTVNNAPVSVTVTPPSATLYGGQTQQFTASVANSSNQTVVWTIVPAGVGTIDSTGLYTAPTTISTQQTVTLTATSLADSTKSASATVTLSLAQCGSNGYSYQRTIIIDHTKVPNTDQSNFPFLFSTTDPLFATTTNRGGHVTNPNGYDIIFTSDAAGQNVLDYEMEEYNPATGQVIAWVRIPTLSHTTDTVLYVFYGNSSITTSQQNPTGVWDSNYLDVLHLDESSGTTVYDSTANGNNGTKVSQSSPTSVSTGEIGGAQSFNGTSDFIALPPSMTSGLTVFSASFWTNTIDSGSNGTYWNRPQFLGDSTAGGSSGDFGVNTDSGYLGMWSGLNSASDNSLISSDFVGNGKWHRIDAVNNGSVIALYLDGQNTGQTLSSGLALDSYGWYLGAQHYYTGGAEFFLEGSFDEFRFSNSARSADWITTEYNNQSSPSTFYALYPENAVGVVPATANLYADQSQQFTATGACGAVIAWSMPPGSPGTLTASGLYTAPASIATQQTVAITASSQGSGESTGTAIVTLLPAPLSPTLTLAVTAQPPYVTGTSQTFTATLKNGSGTPISGEAVTFTVSGANSNTGSSTTDSNGVASYTYTGANSGTDTIQASASISEEQVTSNTVSAVWIVPVQVASSKTVTGEFFLSDGSGTFDTPTSATAAFVQEFPVINFNPPAGTIPGNTSAVDVNSRPFTDVTTDLNGNFTGTIVAQGNGYQAGVGPMWTFQAVFRGTFTVASAGNVVFNFYDDDGFIFGIGNGATRVSGASYNMPAVTPFAQYPVMGADNGPTAPVGNQIIVYFPATGEYPYEVDYSECCGGQLVLTMTSGATNPTGIPPTGSLTITPNSVQPLPIGGQQAFTVFASDASGAPVPNVGVGLEVTGVDNLQLSGTTDATGHATIVYQDMNPGTALVQAVAFISGMVAYSNQVTVPWTLPPSTTTTPIPGNGTMSGSITALPTVTLPNTLSLTGTITDSSGPATPTITIDWSGSEVNGPGTVTFTPPQQTATGSVFNGSTTATFSQAGNYVLQMNASDDVGNSVPGQLLVTVNPVPGTPQGWIGSPVYGSAISGIVPITLASGVTLQSGTLNPQNTLFYYPANNPGKITNIPITAESGTIGTLDTTMLPNGSFWIQLQATDTSGNLEYSLVLVTVTGNYKPGRVTATVTDLVVPSTGLAINIQRTYDSLNAGTSGDFGYGWNLGINVNLVVDNAGNVTFTLGGQRKTFYLTPQYGGWFFPYYFVAYTPEPGLYGKLTDSGSSCSAVFDIVVPDGNLWYCLGIGTQFNATGYVYTDPNGTSYTISAAGNLQSIQDRSGNGLTITATGITSTTGLNVPFVRDANNRITQITDPQGNIYQYGYDTSGNLATVTYPATAQSTTCPNTSAPNTSTYTYDSNHLYLSGTDGRCNPLPVTTYYNSTNDGGNSALDGRMASVTDAFSNTTSYAYNLATNTTTITYPDSTSSNVDQATMVYDRYGMLLSSTDPLGHTTTNAYDANHNLISVTVPRDDSTAYTTTYTYDANGNKTSTTYPSTGAGHNTTSYTYYNQYSEPTSTTDELGNVRTFNYDANYNPQSVTDSIGTLASFIFNPNQTLAAGAIGYDISANPAMASQFTYDPNGNMASRTDALGRTTSYVYNSLGQKTSMVTPTPASPTGGSGSTTSYTYDPFGNLTQTAAPLGRTTSSTYDANGNKTSDTDALGNVTYYQYDALNRLIETDYPSNATTPATKSTKTYDFRNNVVTATDQAGNVTLNAYDLAGRLISVTRGYGSSTPSTTTYEYDNASRKISETDALGNTTNYTYDADSRLTAISGVAGNFQYAYDDAGNRISSTDGNNHTTQFAYDARKRLTKTTYPDTTTVVNTYDGPGNLAGVTDQAGNQVQYTYDAVNQLKTVVQINHPNPSNNTNLYGYDPLGNLTGLTDENIDTTQNLFNVLSEPIQKILPDQKLTETRTYDAAGNLQTLTHFNGVTTTYTYDALNRLLTRSTPGEATVSFTYTATGKYLTSSVGSHTTSYTYDSLDRLITKVTPQGTLRYTYYPNGQVETITSSNTGGASVSYTYDGLNRLSSVVDNNLPGQNTTNYTYDNASNVATVVYPNGLISTFTYDPMNRLTELSMPPIADYKYTLGPTGNRTNATEQSGRSLVWNYDNIYRLTDETISGDPANNSGNNGSATYQLDPVGNRTSASSTFSGFSPVAGSYNADDQLSSETYDANGNTTLAANGNSYTYDSENHMTSATSNGKTITMAYDAFGNRVAKTVNGVTTWYLVEDDVNPTGLPQVMEEKVGGAVQRVYTYGLQRISQYQFFDNQWAASFYVYDGAGSVRQLADSTGNVTDEYEYDAYGNSFTKQGTTPNVYLYRGEQYDPDLGLYYLRARYYNPATGRFLSRDPEDGKIKIPATLHKYLYAGGDPVNMIDPTGRELTAYANLLEIIQVQVEFWRATAAVRKVIGGIACVLSIVDVAIKGGEADKFDWAILIAGCLAAGA